MNKEIVLATNNPNKTKEYREMLAPLGYVIYSLSDLNLDSDPIETGKDYRENSLLKAQSVISKVHWPVIADDSGIEIAAFNDFPGLYSARFAKAISDDYEIVDSHVLKMMEGVKNRKARYRCVITLLENSTAKPLYFEGICEGEILLEKKGHHGFGYDPIFHCRENNLDFGTASDDEKNAVSHRYKALQKLVVYLSIGD